MRRRDFIRGFIGSATAWPLAARAQQPNIPAIGWLAGRRSLLKIRNGILKQAAMSALGQKQTLRHSALPPKADIETQLRAKGGHSALR